MTAPAVPPSPAHPRDLATRLRYLADAGADVGTIRYHLNLAAAALDALSPAPPAEPEPCPTCGGRGEVTHPDPFHTGLYYGTDQCAACGGVGVLHPDDAPASPAPPSPEPGEAERLLRALVESLADLVVAYDEKLGAPRATAAAAPASPAPPSPEPPKVRDLMAALEESVRAAKAARRPRPEEADPA